MPPNFLAPQLAPDLQFAVEVGHIDYHQGSVIVVDETSPLHGQVGKLPRRRGFRMDADGNAVYDVTFVDSRGKIFTQEMLHHQLVQLKRSDQQGAAP